MKYLVALMGLFVLGGANAATFPADLTLSWTNASQYVDGSQIEAGDLFEVRIDCYRHDDPTTPILSERRAANGEGLSQSETYVGAILRPGTYTCYGFSIVVDGTESDPSNGASKKYIGKPSPPVIVSFD